jgi:hypothetical protein
VRKLKIDAPGHRGDKSPYVTEDEVLAFFDGISDSKLAKILERYPWVRTRQLGRHKTYHAEDIAIVGQLLDPAREGDPGKKG